MDIKNTKNIFTFIMSYNKCKNVLLKMKSNGKNVGKLKILHRNNFQKCILIIYLLYQKYIFNILKICYIINVFLKFIRCDKILNCVCVFVLCIVYLNGVF